MDSGLSGSGGGGTLPVSPPPNEGFREFGGRCRQALQPHNPEAAELPPNTRGNLDTTRNYISRENPSPERRPTADPNSRLHNTRSTKKIKASITIASLNIRGGGSGGTREKWQHINQIIRENNVGVLAVQETHLTQDVEESLNKQFEKRMLIINSRDPEQPSARAGVAFVLNKNFTFWKEATTKELIAGRAFLLELPWHNNSKINILAVYAPNAHDQNAAFWESLDKLWAENGLPRPDIMLGDLNMVESDIDRMPMRKDPTICTEMLESLKSTLELFDGWRQQYPDKIAHTYLQTATGSQSRIDRIYTTNDVWKCSEDWKIKEVGLQTDHSMVSVKFSNPGAPFIGKGRWIFPAFLLENEDVFSKISKMGITLDNNIERNKHRRSDLVNPQKLFKEFKTEITKYVRSYAKEYVPKLQKEIRKKEKILEKILNDPTTDQDTKTTNAGILKGEIRKLENLRHTKTRDNIATKCHLEAETIGKTWMAMGKECKTRDIFTKLRRPGTYPPEYERRSDKMAEVARKYHEDLQKVDLPEAYEGMMAMDNVLQNVDANIAPGERNSLAKKLKQIEVKGAIRKLPKGKAPGIDGLPHEVWAKLMDMHESTKNNEKPTFNVIKVLTAVYNDIELEGIVEGTGFSEGWMCPIYKKKDRAEIENYRPITVLNSDYKIMTKALTTKLTDAVPDIIHMDQAGFMRGRRIEDQTELVKLLINLCELEEINGAIICLDQEKAYDKISHKFLWKSLEKFGFPASFIRTIRALYQDAYTVVIINGEISLPFKIIRGVRQGDPLSCLLFNIAIESLATMLRKSHLKGMKIKGLRERTIASLFADDTTVYLSEEDSFSDLKDILDDWCKASGAKFNVQKTEIIPVGSQQYRLQLLNTRKMNEQQNEISESIHIAEEGTPTRVLGAFVGNGIEQVNIWAPIKEKIELGLNRWDKTHPTQDGRRLIVNMEVGGCTQYLTRVQGMPEEIEKWMSKKIRCFMGEGASPMISQETYSLLYREGGKKTLDVESRNEAIELMKLKSYLKMDNQRPKWAYVADEIIAKSAPKDQLAADESSKSNIFMQTWKTSTGKKSNMPIGLKRMVKVAKKYNAAFKPLLLNDETKCALPIWHHIGVEKGKGFTNNNKWAKCQRENHKINTVGQMRDFINKEEQGHSGRSNCACRACKDSRHDGCKHPKKCRAAARKLLEALPQLWRPLAQPPQQTFEGNEPDIETGNVIVNEDGIMFDTNIETKSMTDGFRIFNDIVHTLSTPAIRNTPEVDEPSDLTHIYVAGTCKNDGSDNAQPGGGIWYKQEDIRNESLRLPENLKTSVAAEVAIVLRVLQKCPDDQDICINSGSSKIVEGFTKHAQSWEDIGWIGIANKDLMKACIALMRARSGQTKIKATSKEGVKNAHKLAKKGTTSGDLEIIDCTVPDPFKITGAKLSKMTQALIYRGIREKKNMPNRRGTTINLDITRFAIEDNTGTLPTDGKIWMSLKNKSINKNARAYMWKAMHNAYKCGEYWTRINNHEHRARCVMCEGDETMEHILTECKASGQKTIWGLASKVLKLKNINLSRPTFGAILGCGMPAYKDNKGRMLKGKNRLYTIIMSESAHLIWKIRCEWRISREENRDRLHTEAELEKKWVSAINTRLKLDVLATNKRKYGIKAIQPDLVKRTWTGVVKGETSTTEDWTNNPGVLVSIAETRPAGRNR